MITQNLDNWVEKNGIDLQLVDNLVYQVEGVGKFIFIAPREINVLRADSTVMKYENVIFNFAWKIQVTKEELSLINKYEVKYFLYEFGDRFFYTKIDDEPELIDKNDWEFVPWKTDKVIEMKHFKYLGKYKYEEGEDLGEYINLGLRGKYEILNGSRDYPEWIAKAKFLGMEALGICERNSLSGTLPFQLACEKANIKSILGETITIKSKDDTFYEGKVYVLNVEGWKNILRINKAINVDNDKFIDEKELLKLTGGLVFVFDSLAPLTIELIVRYKKAFQHVFYQIDTVEYLSDEKDKDQLMALKKYLSKYLIKLPPILINDSYYLDKEDSGVKKILNKIASGAAHNQSSDQHFKTLYESAGKLSDIFKEDDERFPLLFEQMVDNTIWLKNNSDFKIKLGELHLPKYEYDGDNNELFLNLINQGFEKKVKGNDEVYLNRVEMEVEIIELGRYIDYFLILWDIVQFCNKEGILVGVGRGSAAGSLVSYLLGIVGIDPIVYDLPFERFLNPGRIGKSLPDIDLDVESSGRDAVKRYIESKYGVDHVVSIGTYGTLQIKSAIKALVRERGRDYNKANFVTSLIEIQGDDNYSGLFHCAQGKPELKNYLNDNYDIINNIPLCINQPNTNGIHAAGIVITPKTYNGEPMTVFDWMPVKKMDGFLVSEWEGEYIEKAGFLKEDILGIRQLDKISAILKLVKKNRGIDVDLATIDIEQKEVYELFQDGLNEDVFQFGAAGLKGYCRDLKPDRFEDLIATVSLYRPGAMEVNAHREYIVLKNAKSRGDENNIQYDPNMKQYTETTFGLYIYQEQVMRAFQVIGGFSLAVADDIRKAMGKKDAKLMESYEKQFIDGAIAHGCNDVEAKGIWRKLDAFSGYGFNRAHATAYAITGYFCQWLKYNYPVEFWTTALQFCDEDGLPNMIAEISKTNESIVLSPPDVNNSMEVFTTDFERNTIYWGLSKIKFLGDVAVGEILRDREEGGHYFSIQEFIDRVEKRKVGKRIVSHLILSGSFDQVENIKYVQERFALLKKYYSLIGEDSVFEKEVLPQYPEGEIWKEHFWTIKQKEVSGFGNINFKRVVEDSKMSKLVQNYIEFPDVQLESSLFKDVLVCGVVSGVVERKSKRGKFCQINLFSNDDILYVTMWNESYEKYFDKISNSTGKIMIVTGKVVEDKYKKCNVIHSADNTKIEIV